MTTFTGTQNDFAKALKELVELEFDALEAYKAAIEKLQNPEYQRQLEKFKEEHNQHIEKLNEVLVNSKRDKVNGPSAKEILTKGKVLIANIVGNDSTILKAMLSNEEDTNTAYNRMNKHDDIWPEAKEILKKGLEDEKKHKSWIEETLKEKQDQKDHRDEKDQRDQRDQNDQRGNKDQKDQNDQRNRKDQK